MDRTLNQAVEARGAAFLTLDRPDRHNAFDDALIAALTAALRRASAEGRAGGLPRHAYARMAPRQLT